MKIQEQQILHQNFLVINKSVLKMEVCADSYAFVLQRLVTLITRLTDISF